jgi:large subunit ribosomal protein L23|tara:strand:+ start:630 stop:944 length:315 start_codon:yes stop_codon:yes gene_type:complete
MNVDKVIIGPLLTEKGALLSESLNKFLFKVDRGSNKIEIKKAVERRFKVKVNKVAIVNVKGKQKSMSVKSSGRTIRTQGKRSSWKKAIVTLAKDNTIDLTNMEF